jgi:hypothetical protein
VKDADSRKLTESDIFTHRVEVDVSRLVRELFHLELSTLERISKFTESIGPRLLKLYNNKFPKRCNCCGRVYHRREEYMDDTFPLQKDGAIKNRGDILEFRNCVCGSTLTILTTDRRDTTEFAAARRALFNLCVEKFRKITDLEESSIREIVRKIFQHIIEKNCLLENRSDYELEDLA